MKDSKVWSWLWASLRPFKQQVALLVILAALIGVAASTVPLLFQSMIDTAVKNHSVDWTAVTLYLSISVLTVVPATFVLRERILTSFTHELRGNVLRHLLRMDMSFYEDRGSTKIVSEFGKGISACSTIISVLTSGQLLISVPVALFAVGYIGQYSLLAAGLLILICGATFLGAREFVGQKLEKVEEATQELDNELTFRNREVIQHAAMMRVYGASESELRRYDKQGGEMMVLRRLRTTFYAKFRFLLGLSGNAVDAIVIVIFLPQLISGAISLGTFFAIYLYAKRVVEPATALSDVYSEVKQATVQLKPLIASLSVTPLVTEQVNALTLNPLRDGITLSNVSFSYPDAANPVLQDLNLMIPAGKTTAIVGLTGSGKSTLAKILMRLYDTTAGVVEYDGSDVRNVSFASLYNQIAYLAQEVPIFTDTVMGNVTFGREFADIEAVRTAINQAAATFVFNREGGLFAKIGEMGKKLSGGEKQRIALARVLMRDPSIILLDEATSSLDGKTEALVNAVFEELSAQSGGKTLIIIAHRMSTVSRADQIIVMDAGRIVATGTHDELLSSCVLYQELNGTFAS